MKLLIFGASGMIGQALLREALTDSRIEKVTLVGRSAVGLTDAKLSEIITADLAQTDYMDSIAGCDLCCFCAGSSAAGVSEEAYAQVNYVMPVAIATRLSALYPSARFVYVSGAGTDASERGKVMWARVKGRTENTLKKLPFTGVYLFRPGFIRPLPGIHSKTWWYELIYQVFNILYYATWPLLPMLIRVFTGQLVTSRILARAMLATSQLPPGREVIDSNSIYTLGARGGLDEPTSHAARARELIIRISAATGVVTWLGLACMLLKMLCGSG
ncbi:NAD(P)H-binding protein [Teredinibacter turnerae]|uniref:NAD(P)H-binding protein n=1 Tax=Teredinibacter turnerae TaxID=2426 RepID=UPI0004776FA6|nr:NAD(P)H-binding protein [Teredinibacter turnerae]